MKRRGRQAMTEAGLMIINRAEYQALRDTIARKKLEIEALEFRIKTLLGEARHGGQRAGRG